MFRKLLLFAALCTFLCVGVTDAQSFTQTWDGDLEAIPADNDLASEGARRIRYLKRDLRERIEDEHDFGSTDRLDTGVHVEGSGRCYVQSDAPTTTPGGVTIDDGRCWYDTDDDKFYIYDLVDATWEELVDGSDNMTLSTAQEATGAKTFGDAIFNQIKFTYLNINSDTTADGNVSAYIADTSVGDVTLTLPPVSGGVGRIYLVAKGSSSSNSFIIDGYGAETINNNATLSIVVAYDSWLLLNVDTEWRILSHPSALSIIEAALAQALQDKVNLRNSSIFTVFGGSGSDGDYAITSNTSLSGDPIIFKEYDNLSITSGAELTVDSGVYCLVIGVKGTLTMDNGASIDLDGKGGAAVDGGATGGAGSDGNSGGFGYTTAYARLIPSEVNMGGGGGGGASNSNAAVGGDGGTAGTVGGAGGTGVSGNGSNSVDLSTIGSLANQRKTFSTNAYLRHFMYKVGMFSTGGGGGEGACNGGFDAAEGGNGGGFIYIEANDISITGTPTLTVNGLVGGNADSNSSKREGAGGGGGGGAVIVLYKTISGAATLQAVGASGGSSNTYGGAGGDGGNGTTISWDVDG